MFIEKHYDYGYIDEQSNYHVQIVNGISTTTYSIDLLSKILKKRNIKKKEPIYLTNHYLLERKIKIDNEIYNVVSVSDQFLFGRTRIVLLEDNDKSSRIICLKNESNSIESEKYEDVVFNILKKD